MRNLWWWQTQEEEPQALRDWCAARTHWLVEPPTTQEALLSQLFRRELLQRTTGIAPSHQRFVTGVKGKPTLADSSVHFSVAHSQGWHLLLLSDAPCGVDVEPWDRQVNKMMTPAALKRFAERDALVDAPTFLRCWTMKEAWAKSRGDSVWQVLAEPLESTVDGWRVSGQASGYAALNACVAWVAEGAAHAPALHHFTLEQGVSVD